MIGGGNIKLAAWHIYHGEKTCVCVVGLWPEWLWTINKICVVDHNCFSSRPGPWKMNMKIILRAQIITWRYQLMCGLRVKPLLKKSLRSHHKFRIFHSHYENVWRVEPGWVNMIGIAIAWSHHDPWTKNLILPWYIGSTIHSPLQREQSRGQCI